MAVVFLKKAEAPEDAVKNVLGGLNWRGIIRKDDSVLVKPNFCTRKPRVGATTNVLVLKGIIETLRDRTEDISIIETSSNARKLDKFYQNLSMDCKLLDLTKERSRTIHGKGGIFSLPERIFNAKLVNVPVLKTHDQTLMTGCLKNMFGLVQSMRKYRYHHKINDVILDINTRISPDINILDATYCMEGIGPYLGPVKKLDVIGGATNALALDIVGCWLMKLDPMRVKHIKMAIKKFQINPNDIAVEGDNFEALSSKFVLPTRLEIMYARLGFHPIFGKPVFGPLRGMIHRLNKVQKKLI